MSEPLLERKKIKFKDLEPDRCYITLSFDRPFRGCLLQKYAEVNEIDAEEIVEVIPIAKLSELNIEYVQNKKTNNHPFAKFFRGNKKKVKL